MRTVHAVAELREQVGQWRRSGERIGFVPTMGNLHRGHLALVRAARAHADRVVASVFVNPLQFGPSEDFNRYPRTLAADQAALESVACDLLFAPAAAEMYPRGMDGLTRVSVPGVADILCGAFRPGHFDGVTTVVNLLFNQVQPDVAVFGEKDYQQLFLIRRMAADLQIPVSILGMPTERDADGLALSSRNQYLSAAERARAPRLYATLQSIAAAITGGRRDFGALAAEGRKQLEAEGFSPQYLEILRPDLMPPTAADARLVVLVAAYLGRTRLIDNLAL